MLVSHRGIDVGFCPYPESTIEAFGHELKNGFGIEFDINFTRDEKVIVFHDTTISRITDGKSSEKVTDLYWDELIKLKNGNNFCLLGEVFELLSHYPRINNALHIKGKFQDRHLMDLLINELSGKNLENIVIFDIFPNSARKLLENFSTLKIAPSVSHDYDIERFNDSVGGTLLSVEQVLKLSSIYSWVWLDEWDRKSIHGEKEFVCEETFDQFRSKRFNIGLVTPELHGRSPGLLGGEFHEDSTTDELLFSRISNTIALNPDIICTDYSSRIKNR